MNRWLFTYLLRAVTRLLPADRRDDYLCDWLADHDVEPRSFLHALTYLPAACRMRAPFEVGPQDVARVHLLDRFLLVQGKLVWGFFAFTFVSLFLTLLVFGGWTADHVLWLTGAAMFLIYSGGLVRTGWSIDLPWLRMTRIGSSLQLFLVLGSLVIIAQQPTSLARSAALLTIYTVLTWTAYWGVHRPLKKRGLLSR